MKTFPAFAIAATLLAGTASVAQARDGCGNGYYRGPHGNCRIIGGPEPVVVVPGRLIIGNYYHGRGYWDGHRYWQNRYRHHNEWRYR